LLLVGFLLTMNYDARNRELKKKEIMVVYFKNYLKQIKAACGQNAEF